MNAKEKEQIRKGLISGNLELKYDSVQHLIESRDIEARELLLTHMNGMYAEVRCVVQRLIRLNEKNDKLEEELLAAQDRICELEEENP